MIHIILPAYNEEAALTPLVTAVAAALETTGTPYSILIVDDGSTDGTAAMAQQLAADHPIDLVSQPQNRGLASAIRTGLTHALERAAPTDVLVTMDCDNTHDPRYILDMVVRCQAGYDVVIASRFASGAAEVGLPLYRRILSRGARFLLHWLFPIPGVRDYTTCYRAYHPRLLREAISRYGDQFIESEGFASLMEILVKLRPFVPKVSEVPLIYRYDRKSGPSKMRLMRTVFEYLRIILRLWPNQGQRTEGQKG